MTTVAEVAAFLTDRGAAELGHPGGTLLAHLRRTHDVLSSWGARPALALAGLAHAAYGTDGFDHGLIDVADRETLAAVVGAEAEEIIYRYGSCERVYRQLSAGAPEIVFTDRFTGTSAPAPTSAVRDFAELTIANELDVLAHNDELRQRHGKALHRLFAACTPYASPAAIAACAQQAAP